MPAFLPTSFGQKVTKPNCNLRKVAQFAFVGKTQAKNVLICYIMTNMRSLPFQTEI